MPAEDELDEGGDIPGSAIGESGCLQGLGVLKWPGETGRVIPRCIGAGRLSMDLVDEDEDD
jgi:hypothetical protein